MFLPRLDSMRQSVLLALLGAITASGAESGTEPTLEVDPSRGLLITQLPEVLNQKEVEPQLTKGLTTTIVFRVDLIGVANGKDVGGARVTIRYELWDEVFKVEVSEVDGELRRAEFSTRETLFEWWSGTKLLLVPMDFAALNNAARARVTLDVVPFSQSEERDTQEWFSQSVSSAELPRSEGAATSVSGATSRSSGVFGVLIATSIRGKPLTSYRWTLDVHQKGVP